MDKQLDIAERKYQKNTKTAVANALAGTAGKMKMQEAKLAQLKHVLEKANVGSGDFPEVSETVSWIIFKEKANFITVFS